MNATEKLSIVWREIEPGKSSPLSLDIAGTQCLVAFRSSVDQLRFHVDYDIDESAIDKTETMPLAMIAARVNGEQYKALVINPGMDDEHVYTCDDLRALWNDE